MSKEKTIGCYIHIPFCDRICSYCDFCKVFKNEELVNKYLDELETEISSSYNKEEVDTIYIGGGTPSCLSERQLEKLLSTLKNNIILTKNYEYTMECNFDSTTKAKLDLMKKYGINRISFGLESIDSNNLRLLERENNLNHIREIIDYCNEIGINNINLDLMYAIPNETLDILEKDLDFCLSLDIKHLSTYSLILEEHTKLKINNTSYIDEEIDAKMYELICNKLSNWDHYEISNFAKNSSYRSTHNLKYWQNKEYYGFGLGAAGYEGNVRYSKTRSLTKYLKGDYIRENDGIEYLSIKDKVYYEVIMNLRTEDGIDLENFKNKYGKSLDNFYTYKQLIEENLLVIKNNHISIPKKLWYISNSVIVRLLEGEVQDEFRRDV